MDLRVGLRLLRERWKVIVAATVVAAAASGLVTWQETPQYASQVMLFVSAWGRPDDTASAYQGSLLSQQKVKSYTELLRGHQVMAGVVDRLGLDLTPRELSRKVSTAIVPDTSLLTATVRDPDPGRARQLADAVGAEFVALVPALESVGADQQPAVKVTVVSPAELPSAPVSPQPVRNLAVGTLLGLLLGCGLATARRALDTTVKTPEQAEELSGAPSLATVAFDGRAGRNPLINAAMHTPRAEAYRKLRTNLQFADVDRPHKVILVTSAAPDEGKSVTACNLAIAMAETGRRVVLIDGDLRRPSVAGYLGLPSGVGLTSVLLGDASPREATQSWGGQMLSVLTSGPIPPNPTALLSSQRLRNLLETLAVEYDLVVVDSPPTLPVADAAVLAGACDGVALVVRHGKTRHEQLRGTVQALRTTGTPILGTVLNQAPPRRGNAYYYSYAPATRVPGRRHQGKPAAPGSLGAPSGAVLEQPVAGSRPQPR